MTVKEYVLEEVRKTIAQSDQFSEEDLHDIARSAHLRPDDVSAIIHGNDEVGEFDYVYDPTENE